MALPFQNIFGKPGEAPVSTSASTSQAPASSAPVTSPFTVAQQPAPNSPFAQPQGPAVGPTPPPPPPVGGGESLASDGEVVSLASERIKMGVPSEFLSALNPPAGPIRLPAGQVEREPGSGVIKTRLSVIYQACPQLFSRPVTEEADRDVTIPALISHAPGGPQGGAPASGGAKPNPFTAAGAAASPATTAVANPSPFGMPAGGGASSPLKAGGMSVKAPSEEKDAASDATDEEPTVALVLRDLVTHAPESELDPDSFASEWKVEVPLSVIRPQMAKGRVVLSLAQVRDFSVPAEAAAAFGGCGDDLEFPVPLKSVFEQLPPDLSGNFGVAAPASASSPPSGEIATPFTVKAEQEKGGAASGSAGSGNPAGSTLFGAPKASAMPGGASGPGGNSMAPEATEAASSPGGVGMGVGGFPPPASAQPATKTESEEEGDGPLSLDDLEAPKPSGGPGDVGPQRGPVSASRPSPGGSPSTVGGAQPAASGVALGGVQIDHPSDDHIELRAVFATRDPFTPGSTLEKTRELPGVEGCALFRDAANRYAEVPPEDEAGRKLVQQTPEIYERIRGLARDLGFDESRAFTLRTSSGALSFFEHDGVCLSVVHRSAEFDPGIREKLVLISRGAAALVG